MSLSHNSIFAKHFRLSEVILGLIFLIKEFPTVFFKHFNCATTLSVSVNCQEYKELMMTNCG